MMRIQMIIVFGWLLVGCTLTPQVTWSPDGKSGNYQSVVIDPNGKTVTGLGPPGFADGNGVWSADSSSLYYNRTEVTGNQPPVTANRQWVDGADAKQPAQILGLPQNWARSTIYRWRDGKSEPVVTLWATWVLSMAVSSDQRWLLIEGFDITPGTLIPTIHLQAYQMQSKKLYTISDTACGACCFTGPNRVAFVECENAGRGTSHVVEVTLDESVAPLDHTVLLTVLTDSTTALAGVDNHLLILTYEATFPSPAIQPVAEKIYAIQRDDKSFHELAAGSSMSLSPDGKRVLFIHTSNRGNNELALMDVDGKQQRTLMDLTVFPAQLPITPTWHGNDRITFAATTPTVAPPATNPASPGVAAQPERLVYDIVDYAIPAAGPMQPVQTISHDWRPEAKPSSPLMTVVPNAQEKQ